MGETLYRRVDKNPGELLNSRNTPGAKRAMVVDKDNHLTAQAEFIEVDADTFHSSNRLKGIPDMGSKLNAVAAIATAIPAVVEFAENVVIPGGQKFHESIKAKKAEAAERKAQSQVVECAVMEVEDSPEFQATSIKTDVAPAQSEKTVYMTAEEMKERSAKAEELRKLAAAMDAEVANAILVEDAECDSADTHDLPEGESPSLPDASSKALPESKNRQSPISFIKNKIRHKAD